MNTLICLLSGQPVPNLMSCAALQPDRIILVQTFRMKGFGVADKFQNALKKMNIQVNTQVVDLPEGKDNDFPFLKDYFRKHLRKAFPEDSFSLNLTGGTKPMSIALYQTFHTHRDAEFFYFDVDFPCEIIDFCEDRRWPVGQIPLDAFLEGYGYHTSKNKKHIEVAEKTALKRAETTNLLACYCNESDFRIWGKANSNRKWVNEAMDSKNPSPLKQGVLSPSAPEITDALAQCFRLQKTPEGSLLGNLKSHEVKYLDGGWLEEFIWLTLHQFEQKYQLADLHLGQVIQKSGSNTSNELDISFMRNNTFHVLECKTGFQEKLPLYLYKLYAVTKELQANGTKTFLISNSRIITTNESQERARLHSTKLIDAESIHNLAIDPEKELDKIFSPSKP